MFQRAGPRASDGSFARSFAGHNRRPRPGHICYASSSGCAWQWSGAEQHGSQAMALANAGQSAAQGELVAWSGWGNLAQATCALQLALAVHGSGLGSIVARQWLLQWLTNLQLKVSQSQAFPAYQGQVCHESVSGCTRHWPEPGQHGSQTTALATAEQCATQDGLSANDGAALACRAHSCHASASG